MLHSPGHVPIFSCRLIQKYIIIPAEKFNLNIYGGGGGGGGGGAVGWKAKEGLQECLDTPSPPAD